MKDGFLNEKVFLQNLNATFDQLDHLRIEGLEDLKLMQEVKSRALEKERIRLVEKLGKDHARIEKIDARLAYNQGLSATLEVELQKTEIKVPETDAKTWMVHGLVLDKKRKGVKGLTIGLSNEKGQWIKKLGYACTDEKGYFALRYTPQELVKEGVSSKEIDQKEGLYLIVSDSEQKIIYRDPHPLYITPGQIDYRLIILDDQGVCVPPEGGGDTMTDPDVWWVRGRVTDEQDKGLSGLTISVFDKDLLFDDLLGTCQTGDNGEFDIRYRTEDFRDLVEARPDLYLKILDKEGNVLYTTKKATRYEAGHVETFNVQIKDGGSKKKGY